MFLETLCYMPMHVYLLSGGSCLLQSLCLCIIGSAVTSETRFISADSPNDEFKVVLPRENDVEYEVYHRGDAFYMTFRSATLLRLA